MTQLTPAQNALLTALLEASDNTIAAQDRKVAGALVRRGFAISVPEADGQSRLILTEAGRKIIAPARGACPVFVAGYVRARRTRPAVTGKLGALIGLLTRPEGARLDEMVLATGWQSHSVRGAMSGALKKKRGLHLVSEKGEGGRTYRILQQGGQS